MDIFCLPSYANEGVPQAILQAMLTGLPIVTTPVGAILEAVTDGETALIVPPKDATALAAAMDRLIRSADVCTALGTRTQETALARFGMERMLSEMECIFKKESVQ